MFADRSDAGRRLARMLLPRDLVDPLVLGLPRGGVAVARPVADALRAPLEVFVARKIADPGNPELGVGAIAEGGGPPVFDAEALAAVGRRPEDLAEVVAREREELVRRVARYRRGRPLPPLSGRAVVLVDDGLATGVTARAALRALRSAGPGALLLAVPVGASSTVAALAGEADEVVCLHATDRLRAIGPWYDDFSQLDDAEVLALLGRG
ncbi:MAG: phosphoribosyltransferase [Actinomycetota bacterium]